MHVLISIILDPHQNPSFVTKPTPAPSKYLIQIKPTLIQYSIVQIWAKNEEFAPKAISKSRKAQEKKLQVE